LVYLKKTVRHIRLILMVLLGGISFAAIFLLSVNVSRDLRLLNSATSDNIQWTLSQAEVEFMEFEIMLDASVRDPSPDLVGLRRDYDIFYSRISTLRQASIYAPVRRVPEFSQSLDVIRAFLDDVVQTVDAPDAQLVSGLSEMSRKAMDVRSTVRTLSNSGLNYFARESDRQRERVAKTLSQMAMVVTLLMSAILASSLYLGYLNRQNVRRRKEAIQVSKRMKVVTGTALDAVIVCDIDGMILEFNEAAIQTFGYTAEEAIGRDLGKLIVPAKYRDAHDSGMQRMRDSGEKRFVGKGRVRMDSMRANGEVFPVEFAVQSAETEEGEIFIAFLRDISNSVAAEAELVAARDRALAGDKAKTDFLATMSHEIRTPLNGLLGNLTLLSETRLSAQQSRYIKNMDTSGRLLMSHISDVLDITKYDANKLQLRPMVMNIGRLFQDIVDNQSGAAAAHNTTLTWGWAGERCDWIIADKDRIQHILMNVIGNAVKFTRDGQVAVGVGVGAGRGAQQEITITVSDTGLGMDAALKAQIFNDFTTGDASYDRDVGGTGLGLGIALRFAKAMGGTITVQSEKGEGSIFTIVFPIKPAQAPEKAVHRVALSQPKLGRHILLVEDNEINCAVAREMLLAQGYAVTEAENGKIAVELAARHQFDLILMDISMPVMDGRTATRAIRASGLPSANTPIVALTANAMAEERKAFLSDGMNAILTKPMSREGLFEVLGLVLDAARAPSPASDAQTVIDPRNMEDLLELLGKPALHALLARFRAELDDVIGMLTLDQPLEQLAEHAHRIAGSAATVGAVRLRQTLIRIENAAKQGDVSALSDGITRLPEVWQATRPLLVVA